MKSGSLKFFKAQEVLGSIGVDPYRCQDPKNLIISLFRPIGGQFGPIFLICPIIWGSPLGPLFIRCGPALFIWCGPSLFIQCGPY